MGEHTLRQGSSHEELELPGRDDRTRSARRSLSPFVYAYYTGGAGTARAGVSAEFVQSESDAQAQLLRQLGMDPHGLLGGQSSACD